MSAPGRPEFVKLKGAAAWCCFRNQSKAKRADCVRAPSLVHAKLLQEKSKVRLAMLEIPCSRGCQ